MLPCPTMPTSLSVTWAWISALYLGAALLGLFFSYRTDSPYGPSLVLAMGLFFLVALFVRALLPAVEGGAS